MTEVEARIAIVNAGRRLVGARLLVGMEGNISVRLGEHALCTPRGVRKDELEPEDMVLVSGPTAEGVSSEYKMHARIYQEKPEIQAVVHAHPLTATALTMSKKVLPDALTPEAAAVLGPLAHVPFAMPGTEEVPEAMVPFLSGHRTFILAYHGATTVSTDLDTAVAMMETLEATAILYLIAETTGGYQPMPESARHHLLGD